MAWTAFRTPAIQTLLARQLTNQLSEKIDAPISVGKVRFRFNKSLIIKDLLIKDQLLDTALYIKQLELGIKDLDLNLNKISLSKLNIDKAYFNLYQLNNQDYNIDALLESLLIENSEKFNWQINCAQLNLVKARCKYAPLIGETLISNNISAKFSDFKLDSTVMSIQTNEINIQANNKNIIENLTANIKVEQKHLFIDSLLIRSENSNIKIQSADFNLDKNKDFSGNIDIESSRIVLNDFSVISTKLEKFAEEISVSGDFDIFENAISGQNLKCFIGNNSSIIANFRLLNYTSPKELAYYINFENGYTNYNDIKFIAESIFNVDSSTIPKELELLGGISYQGLLKGNKDSIFSKGDLYSDLGIINSNLIIKKDETSENFQIQGEVSSKPFYLHKVTNNQLFGELVLNLKTNGVYSKTTGANFNIDGIISHVDLNQYSLDSIVLNGKLTDNNFKGTISSYDPNLRADFKGEIHLGNIKSYNFTSSIYNLNLHTLGLNKKDSISTLSVNIEANLSGNTLQNSEGSLIIKNLFLFQDTSYFATDSISIFSKSINNEKQLSLYSEFIDINFTGKYYLPTLLDDFSKLANNYIPALASKFDTTMLGLNNFEFDINAKFPHPLTDFIYSDLRISPGTIIKGEFSSKNSNLFLSLNSGQIKLLDRTLSDIEMQSFSKNNKFYINLASKELKYTSDNSLKNFLLSLTIHNDTIKSNVNWNNWLDKNYSGNINAEAILQDKFNTKTPNFKVNFSPSNIIIVDTLWSLNRCSILKDSSGIAFNNMKIEKGKSILGVDGKLSHNPNDSIALYFSNLDLHNLNVLLKKNRLRFDGDLNGNTILKDIYGERIIMADFDIQDFSLNDEYVGNTYGKSKWNKEKNQIDLSGYIKNDSVKALEFDGFIAAKRKDMSLNLSFMNYNMELLEAFLKPTFDDISGALTGNVHIYGDPANLKWKGAVFAENTQLKVVPTNVNYHFSDSIMFYENNILFSNINLYDKDSNVAMMHGFVYHERLKDFSVNFQFNTERLLALETTSKHHPYYHGTVYSSGIVDIQGPTKDVVLNISATTLNNSTIIIPLAVRSEIKENNFITFIDPTKINSPNKQLEEEEAENPSIKAKTEINIDLTITPATDIQIILDPTVGDVLQANGNAQINIESKPDAFGIYGDFIIDKGEFLFTIQDVINKKLEIVQGSTVSWTGDPIEADIDLDAIYKIRRASIYDLTQSDLDIEKRVPVDCHLLMTNKLTNPDIRFEIEVTSNTNNEAIEQINSLPEDEINKQIISLILLNKFAPLTTANSGTESSATASLGATTVSELLSNQLSHWMSQLNSNFDLGFTYRPGSDEIQNEYQLALSTSLWDDRVTVYGNVGYGGQYKQTEDPSSAYTTDFTVELKVNKKGNIRLRAFQKENDDIDELNPAPYKQGIGIFYTEEFDNFTELMQKMFRKKYATKPEEIIPVSDDS